MSQWICTMLVGAVLGIGCGGSSSTTSDAPLSDGRAAPALPFDIEIRGGATLVAVQDEGAAWRELARGGDRYRATIGSERYAVAVACDDGEQSSSTHVYLRTVEDPHEMGPFTCTAVADFTSVSVEAHGLAAGTSAVVKVDEFAAFLTDVPSNLKVRKGLFEPVLQVFSGNPDRFWTGPTQDTATASPVIVDAAAALPLESHALTVEGVASGSISVSSAYWSPHARFGVSVFSGTFTAGGRMSFSTIDARLASAGTGSVSAVETHATSDGRDVRRSADLWMAPAADATLAIPADLDIAQPTMTGTTNPGFAFTIPMAPAHLAFVEHEVQLLTLSQSGGSQSVSLFASPSWSQGRSSLDLRSPDLSTLASWTPSMALDPTSGIGWIALRYDRNRAPSSPHTAGERVMTNRVEWSSFPIALRAAAATRLTSR